jgi:hypothetical protein
MRSPLVRASTEQFVQANVTWHGPQGDRMSTAKESASKKAADEDGETPRKLPAAFSHPAPIEAHLIVLKTAES